MGFYNELLYDFTRQQANQDDRKGILNCTIAFSEYMHAYYIEMDALIDQIMIVFLQPLLLVRQTNNPSKTTCAAIS